MMQQFSSILSVVIFGMLISFITSCGGDDELISDSYLPIKVGNFWNFIDPEYPWGFRWHLHHRCHEVRQWQNCIHCHNK